MDKYINKKPKLDHEDFEFTDYKTYINFNGDKSYLRFDSKHYYMIRKNTFKTPIVIRSFLGRYNIILYKSGNVEVEDKVEHKLVFIPSCHFDLFERLVEEKKKLR